MSSALAIAYEPTVQTERLAVLPTIAIERPPVRRVTPVERAEHVVEVVARFGSAPGPQLAVLTVVIASLLIH